MRTSRRLVVAYMALVSVLCAALLAPLVVGLALRPDPPESEDWYVLTYWFGLVGFLWIVGMAAGIWTLRRRSRH